VTNKHLGYVYGYRILIPAVKFFCYRSKLVDYLVENYKGCPPSSSKMLFVFLHKKCTIKLNTYGPVGLVMYSVDGTTYHCLLGNIEVHHELCCRVDHGVEEVAGGKAR
jgi:hypothetical protein